MNALNFGLVVSIAPRVCRGNFFVKENCMLHLNDRRRQFSDCFGDWSHSL